jgi:hypothetical protein
MKDIMLNDDFDLEAEAGELSCRESDEQTLALLMETVPGEWKWSAEDGVGLMRYAGAPGSETQRLKRHIQECMKRNGIEWERIEVEGDVLTVKMKTQ